MTHIKVVISKPHQTWENPTLAQLQYPISAVPMVCRLFLFPILLQIAHHGSWLMAQSRAPRLRKSVTVQAEGIKSAAKTVKIVPKELISRRLSPGFQLKVTWLMWHKLGNRSNTKETSMSKYLEHNKHPRGDTSAKQSIHQFRVHRKLHLQSFQVEFFSQKCEESKRSIHGFKNSKLKETALCLSATKKESKKNLRDLCEKFQSKLRIYSLRRNARRPGATPQTLQILSSIIILSSSNVTKCFLCLLAERACLAILGAQHLWPTGLWNPTLNSEMRKHSVLSVLRSCTSRTEWILSV